MKKKVLIIYLFLISFFLLSCNIQTNNYSLLYTYENEVIEINDFKFEYLYLYNKINGEIIYVNEGMVSASDLQKLKTAGEHKIIVNYLENKYEVNIILASNISYYVLNPYENETCLISEFDLSNIKLVKNVDGEENKVSLSLDMLRDSDKEKINKEGNHIINVLFNNNSFSISFSLVERYIETIISIINPYENTECEISMFKLENIKLSLERDGDITYIDVKESMLSDADFAKTKTTGTHYINVNYGDFSQKIKVVLIEDKINDETRYYIENPYDSLTVNINEFNLSNIKIVIETNSSKEYVPIDSSMLSVSDNNKLGTAGDHEITIIYKDKQFLVNIYLVNSSTNKYIYDHIADGYYSSANNLKGNELKLALRTIINTKVHDTTYAELTTWLAKTDPGTRENTVLLFYLRTSVAAKWDGGNTWNREHVWPKSLGWFSTSKAGSDLHHIRPSDPGENSRRGNKPFGNGSGGTYEPRDAVKGDVARILFYMMVRYSQTDSSYPVTKVATSLDMLLQWHKMDPVDSIEIYRNNKAYELQGNRNPFIDFEGFADYIWA